MILLVLNPFSGEIASIQELPEIQDLNNIWGMGFILSVDSNNYNASFTQSAFQLDTMVLKNSCSTSVGSVQKCADLSLGVNIATQSLTGIDSDKNDRLYYSLISAAVPVIHREWIQLLSSVYKPLLPSSSCKRGSTHIFFLGSRLRGNDEPTRE